MTPERLHRIEEVALKRQPDLTLILENVFDPHNISAVMRTADSVGIHEIFVLNTQLPRRQKWGHKSSSSAAKWLTVHQFDSLEACVKEVRSRYALIYTTFLANDAVSLYQLNLTQSVALVFGNEQSGCSPKMLAESNGNFVIPQVGMVQSLNISVACAVAVYEAFRQKQAAGHYANSKLNAEQVKAYLRQGAQVKQ